MYLFARRNPAESGHRFVQSVKILFDPNIRKGQPGHMSVSSFQMCTFVGLPVGSDVYFMHVYAPRPRLSLESCLWLGRMGINDMEVSTWLCSSMEYNSVAPSHCISMTSFCALHCFGRKF
jgi:hypothetical protein